VVDMRGDALLDIVVRPEHRLVYCNTRFSGLTPSVVESAQYSMSQGYRFFFGFYRFFYLFLS
jgi:hypothetical protein